MHNLVPSFFFLDLVSICLVVLNLPYFNSLALFTWRSKVFFFISIKLIVL